MKRVQYAKLILQQLRRKTKKISIQKIFEETKMEKTSEITKRSSAVSEAGEKKKTSNDDEGGRISPPPIRQGQKGALKDNY